MFRVSRLRLPCLVCVLNSPGRSYLLLCRSEPQVRALHYLNNAYVRVDCAAEHPLHRALDLAWFCRYSFSIPFLTMFNESWCFIRSSLSEQDACESSPNASGNKIVPPVCGYEFGFFSGGTLVSFCTQSLYPRSQNSWCNILNPHSIPRLARPSCIWKFVHAFVFFLSFIFS
jgi:hypothetical protein